MEDVGPELAHKCVDAARRRHHLAQVAGAASIQARIAIQQSAMEARAIDVLNLVARCAMPRRGELERLPTERALLAQDRDSAKRIPAV